MSHVGFLKHIEQLPEVCKPVFDGGSAPLTSSCFWGVHDPFDMEDNTQEKIKAWFFLFIEEATDQTLSKLLHLSTML